MTGSENDRYNKGQKLVYLLDWMHRRGGVRVDAIQDRLGIDARTMRRYIADLRDLNVPVLEEGRGEDRVVILDPSYRRTGLQLTLGEMISLRFGRTLFTFLENTTFAADMNQAIDRLGPTLSRASTDVVQDFDRMFIAVPEPTKNYEETAEIQDEILSALVYRNPIDVEYRPARGEKKNYKLEPYTIAAYRQGLYLFARDTAVDRVKTFAFERFRRATRLRKERFSPPQDWDPGAFVADAFGITVGRPQAVVVRFSAEVAEFIQERTWHRSQGFQPRRDGSVEIILRCAITPELKQWILGFGADAEVLEPESLREEIRGALTAAARRYGTGS